MVIKSQKLRVTRSNANQEQYKKQMEKNLWIEMIPLYL